MLWFDWTKQKRNRQNVDHNGILWKLRVFWFGFCLGFSIEMIIKAITLMQFVVNFL